MKRALGYTLVVLALVFGGAGLYRAETSAMVYSPLQMMHALWLQYVSHYVESGTYRTVDPERGNITTSEGQSYTMLRAAWMADKQTFDGAWNWTKTHLQKNTGVFAWLWGARPDGTYGVLTSQGGDTSASDADTDIALALLMAYGRWKDPAYLTDAQTVIDGIWQTDVVTINGTPYMSADDVEKTSKSPWIVLDPSYFNPAAYRLFAQVDPSHPWSELIDSSFSVLDRSMAAPLDGTTSASLPPDWLHMDRATGTLSAPPPTSGNTTNFGYDALRTPWRLALYYRWFGDVRAQAELQKMSFLSQEWRKNQSLATTYTHSGSVVNSYESPAMYGGTIGYFLFADPASAPAVYEQKLASLYDPGQNAWKQTLSYYDDNWAWFGIGLYNDLLPDLAAATS